MGRTSRSPALQRSTRESSVSGCYEGFADLYTQWRSEAILTDRTTALLGSLPTRVSLAVDAGCGPGLVSEALCERTDRLIAFDASLTMVLTTRRRLRAAGRTNVWLVLADAAAPPFAAAHIDLVVAWYLLHLTELDRTLPALADLVKPGGVLFIVDSVHRRWQQPRTLLGRVMQRIVWPLRVVASGNPRGAQHLARMVWSSEWLRVQRRHGYHEAAYVASCRRHLAGCEVDTDGFQVKVAWTPAPPAPPVGLCT